jgi:glycerol-3-phosphate dehydrogenase
LLNTFLAPHLVRIERFTVPVYGSWWQLPYVASGLSLYDLLGGRRDGRFHRLTRAQALSAIPGLREEKLRGALDYADGVFDDARLVVAVARSAARFGAAILTQCEVDLTTRADGSNPSVLVTDRIDGEQLKIEARVVIDATGAFDFEPSTTDRLLPSRGAHLVVPRSKIPIDSGLTLRTDGRVVFVIPWGEHCLIGTTDVPHEGPVDRPTATREEVAYLLDSLAETLDVQLSPEDIVSTFAGIRPLVGKADDPSAVSREDAIEERKPGVITVRGGKYTTYRRVAERAIDFAAPRFGKLPPSPTSRLPVVGALPKGLLSELAVELSTETKLGFESAEHLVARYGSEARQVALIAATEDLSAPLVEGLPYLKAEAVWAIRHEYAMSIDDVLARRTRLTLEDRDHGKEAAVFVADLLADTLGWTSPQRESAVEQYRRSVSVEYGVPGPLLQGVAT